MYKVIAVFVAVFVFAGSAEAQRLQPVGPWFLHSVVDNMTDEIIAVAVLREDNPPRLDASTVTMACVSGSEEIQFLWNTGDVISRNGFVAYRFDSELAGEGVWNLADPKTLAANPNSGFVERFILANRLVLRTLNYAGVQTTKTFTIHMAEQALNRIKSVCGLFS
jgi:hypothetical protein